MVKITEILNLENQRQDNKTWSLIYLWKDGNFYRAYNWSAWLIVNFEYNVSLSKDNKPLAVTRKIKTADKLDICYVGFPVKSLHKFIPSSSDFDIIDKDYITVFTVLPQTENTNNYESLSKSYLEWKESQPITEDKKKKNDNNDANCTSSPNKTLTQIMSQVISYPIERKTPIENIEFLSLLKQQLAKLI